MTNDDNTRKDRGKTLLDKIVNVGGGLAMCGGALMIAHFIVGIVDAVSANKPLKEAARYLAFEHYVPVGNGGALAVMHGHTTPERQSMLEAVEAVFLVKYNGQAPVRTFAEYKLKTTPDLSDTERQDLQTIIDRYKPRGL